MKRRKTTKKDFKRFKEVCVKWLEFLQVNDWEILFHWGNLAKNNSQAECSTTISARRLELKLTRGRIDLDPAWLARHEVIEGVIFGKIRIMAAEGFAESRVTEEVHRLTHILADAFGRCRKKEQEL